MVKMTAGFALHVTLAHFRPLMSGRAETTSKRLCGVQPSPQGMSESVATVFSPPCRSTCITRRAKKSEHHSLPSCHLGHSGNLSVSTRTVVFKSIWTFLSLLYGRSH